MVGSKPAGTHSAHPATNSHALTPWQRERLEAVLAEDRPASGCTAMIPVFLIAVLMWTAVVCMVLG